MGKVKWSFKSHAPMFLSLGVQIGLKGLIKVMPLPISSILISLPFYVAIFLAFGQDIEDQIIYGSFMIIYEPISLFSISNFGAFFIFIFSL